MPTDLRAIFVEPDAELAKILAFVFPILAGSNACIFPATCNFSLGIVVPIPTLPSGVTVTLVAEFVSNFKLAEDEFDVILKFDPSKFKFAFPEAAVGILIFPLFPTVTFPAKVAFWEELIVKATVLPPVLTINYYHFVIQKNLQCLRIEYMLFELLLV